MLNIILNEIMIPNDIINIILDNLEPNQLFKLMLVSKSFNQAVTNFFKNRFNLDSLKLPTTVILDDTNASINYKALIMSEMAHIDGKNFKIFNTDKNLFFCDLLLHIANKLNLSIAPHLYTLATYKHALKEGDFERANKILACYGVTNMTQERMHRSRDALIRNLDPKNSTHVDIFLDFKVVFKFLLNEMNNALKIDQLLINSNSYATERVFARSKHNPANSIKQTFSDFVSNMNEGILDRTVYPSLQNVLNTKNQIKLEETDKIIIFEIIIFSSSIDKNYTINPKSIILHENIIAAYDSAGKNIMSNKDAFPFIRGALQARQNIEIPHIDFKNS